MLSLAGRLNDLRLKRASQRGFELDSFRAPGSTDGGAGNSQLTIDIRTDGKGASKAAVNFYFIRAREVLKTSPGTMLPRFQDVPKSWIVKQPIELRYVVKRHYIEQYLAVSHRWEDPNQPDTKGAQLDAIRDYCRAHPRVKYIFFECASGPRRTPPPVSCQPASP